MRKTMRRRFYVRRPEPFAVVPVDPGSGQKWLPIQCSTWTNALAVAKDYTALGYDYEIIGGSNNPQICNASFAAKGTLDAHSF